MHIGRLFSEVVSVIELKYSACAEKCFGLDDTSGLEQEVIPRDPVVSSVQTPPSDSFFRKTEKKVNNLKDIVVMRIIMYTC